MGANTQFARPPSATAPAYDWAAITANDTTIHHNLRAIYVGTSGNLAVVSSEGSTETFSSVPVGILAIAPEIVKSTGTTATGLIGLK